MNIKIKFLFLFLFILLLNCISDKYEIKDNKRDPIFIEEFYNNYNCHLFWFPQKDNKGKFIKDKDNKKLLFDSKKDTMIFIHGWQGVGMFGWMEHSILENRGPITVPIIAIISLLYNIPSYGAALPNFEKMPSGYNFAIFDWQNYNNITKEHENSENLAILEQYLRKNPEKWPSIPENLAKEIELISPYIEPEKYIYLISHSIGNQVVIRAYDLLSFDTKRKIKLLILLDPFITEYYNYLGKKVGTDPHWITGLTSKWLKEDLMRLIERGGLKEKIVVIPTTDIGKSWTDSIAIPLNIKVIDNDYKNFPLNLFYASKTKKYHDEIIKWFFWDKKYYQELGIE